MKSKKIFVRGLILLTVLLLFSACAAKEYVPYDYELSKYITVGTYKEIPYDYVELGVSADQLQRAINDDLNENGYGTAKSVTSGETVFGDTLTIAFKGEIDGASAEELNADNVTLTIGNGTFLDDFENSLIGQEIGKKCQIDVTFPEDYIKIKYAGKKVKYSVDILNVVRNSYPELTDKIVSDISECKSVEEYTEMKTAELEEQNLQQADQDKENEIWNEIVAASEVKQYPKNAIEFLTATFKKEFEDTAKSKDQKLSEYLAENGISEEEFETYLQKKAELTCKDEMVMYSIARFEKIKADSDEIEALAKTYADTYDYKSVSELYKKYNKNLVEQTVLYQKVKDFVVENAKQK